MCAPFFISPMLKYLLQILVVIPICVVVLFADLDLAFCGVRILAFQVLKITPVFLCDGMLIDDNGM